HHLPDGAAKPPPVGFAMMGPDPRRFLLRYPGLIGNLPVLEQAAARRAMLTMQPVPVRTVLRATTLMLAHGTLLPAMTLDMLRVVTRASAFRVNSGPAGVRSVAIPALDIPTDGQGQLWIHFAPYDANRYVSAKDVLEGRVPPERVARKLVLVGTSA